MTPHGLPLSRLPYVLPHVRVQRLVHTILATRWDHGDVANRPSAGAAGA